MATETRCVRDGLLWTLSAAVVMQDGRSALYNGAWKGHAAIVGLLLTSRAAVNAAKTVCLP